VSQLHSSTKALGRLQKKPSGAPRLSSLLSSTPLLFSILREEQAEAEEEEEELQRSKTLSLPDATTLLLSTSSTSASDSAVPLSTQTRGGPPVSPRGNTSGGGDGGAEADADQQQQQQLQPDTLFNSRDLKLLRNKDIACLIQVLSSLAALKPTRAKLHDSADDDDGNSDGDDDDAVTRQQRQHGKDLSASEEEQRVALRHQRRSTADEPDDLSLDFGRLCSFYTEAAVRALLRYYAESIVELVFPDHPHVRLSAGLSHLQYPCADFGRVMCVLCVACRRVCRVSCVSCCHRPALQFGDGRPSALLPTPEATHHRQVSLHHQDRCAAK
jgi:ferredoxin